jgi:hypothetical protein
MTYQEKSENVLDIHTISNNWAINQADHDLLLGQVIDKKVDQSHFLKFLLASCIPKAVGSIFGFDLIHEANASQNQKSRFFTRTQMDSELNTQLTLKVEAL